MHRMGRGFWTTFVQTVQKSMTMEGRAYICVTKLPDGIYVRPPQLTIYLKSGPVWKSFTNPTCKSHTLESWESINDVTRFFYILTSLLLSSTSLSVLKIIQCHQRILDPLFLCLTDVVCLLVYLLGCIQLKYKKK